jgi:hypothetical protein
VVGERLKQWSKLGDDVRPLKVMCKNTKPIGIIALGTVTKHIPSKPHRDHNSEHEQEGQSSCNKLNHKK